MRFVLPILCLVMMVTTTPPLRADSTQTEIGVIPVTDNIRLLSCFYGKHWVNVTAFSGPDGLLVVDAGHKRTAQALFSKLQESSLGPVTYIISTHLHGDHTGGNDTLGVGATIIAHENVSVRLPDKANDSLNPWPDVVLTDSLILPFNGDTVRVIHLPNGHTDGDVIVHFVGAKVVCLGDLLFSDAIPHIFKYLGGSLDGFINNLGRVLEMFPDDVRLIPGHGRIYTMAELRQYRDMLAGITRRVRSEFAAGKEIDEVIADGVLKDCPDSVSQEFVSDTAFVYIVWDNDRGD